MNQELYSNVKIMILQLDMLLQLNVWEINSRLVAEAVCIRLLVMFAKRDLSFTKNSCQQMEQMSRSDFN